MTGHHGDFDAFLKSKEVVGWLSPISKEKTRAVYVSALFRYWRDVVSKNYATLWDWIIATKSEFKSDDNPTRKKWTLDLLAYVNGYRSKAGQPMGFSAKNILVAAVLGFLRFHVDDRLSFGVKFEESTEELQRKQKPAMSEEDVRKLYDACQSNRDRTLVLIAVNGVAPAEMIQLTNSWKRWFHKDPAQMKAPFRVPLVREKVGFPYHVTLWQDACQALRDLYAERMMETGGQVNDLFLGEKGEPFTRRAYDLMIVRLRERAGLYEAGKIYEAQRVHAHGFRHFFKTQAKLYNVDQTKVEFALGHAGDDYGYDKSHMEPKFCTAVEKELEKMLEVLNLRTGHAQEYYATKDEELRLQIAKDTYRALLETGGLKPEALNETYQRLILEKLGLKNDIQVPLMAEDDNLPADIKQRIGLFDVIAQVVELDGTVYRKYMDAFRALRPENATAKWENHTDFYMRTEVGSDDYMQALADGFKTIDQDGWMRIMVKPKSNGNPDTQTGRQAVGGA